MTSHGAAVDAANTVTVGAVSVKGPCKVKNQDAYAVAKEPYPMVAVADGHGSEAHCFSDIGAQKAVACALEVLQNVCDALTGGEAAEAVLKLLDQAAYDLQQKWQQAVHADATFQMRPFGTTLMVIAYVQPWLICLQIGDGKLIYQNSRGQLIMPMPQDRHLQGEETHSLSESFAWNHFRKSVLHMASPPIFFGGCSDGLEKAYPFHSHGFTTFFLNELYGSNDAAAQQASQYAGDDVTAAAVYFTPPSVSEKGVFENQQSSPVNTLKWQLPYASMKMRLRTVLWFYYALRTLKLIDENGEIPLTLMASLLKLPLPEDGNLHTLMAAVKGMEPIRTETSIQALKGMISAFVQCLPEGRTEAWIADCESVEALQSIESLWNYDFEKREASFTSSPKGWSLKSTQKVMTLMLDDIIYGFDLGFWHAYAIVPIAKIVSHKRTGRWGLRNLSKVPWIVYRRGETDSRTVYPGEIAALMPEMTVFINGLPVQVIWRDFVS
ncbi:protein phosphatase 2C domain-containing protein [Fusibacter paucivorans]|uniref:Protein phosphatase 2C domain-containing protein n=1 Tax=Fusibacter paucivorans TaxID=76009 RepID=A0ABS5PP22_9FIRM|nr:protein phosphatase 2C domain-containing protein [Fusibacter paucivorans]MBS7526129.1 protein phosphatase 2C domain-containing protein [Fusibacter paucivorans]